MKKVITVFLLILLGLSAVPTFAHEHHHEKTDSILQTVSKTNEDTSMQKEMKEHHEMKVMDAFPNYHPLIVHFPIVLLLMAALFQLLSFFFYKKEFSIVTLILLSLGVISAWFSSNTFHADTEELTGRAKEIFAIHEQMASFTWWLSLVALLIKIPSHFFLKRKWWMEIAVAVLLLCSAITVSISGHHGAMLVHIEGIGPKGEHLELHDHDVKKQIQ
ncbi:MAG: DUF2231 domain-containing protein [Bacteroidia bacterium]